MNNPILHVADLRRRGLATDADLRKAIRKALHDSYARSQAYGKAWDACVPMIRDAMIRAARKEGGAT